MVTWVLNGVVQMLVLIRGRSAMFILGEQRKEHSRKGYSLIELLVVMVIVGILATQVVSGFNSADRKLKSAVFSLRNEVHYARSEAVSRGQDVKFTFLPGASVDAPDGYRIWIDDHPVGGPPNNTYTAGSDTLLKEDTFRDEVQLYDTPVAEGPPFSGGDNPAAGSNGVDFTADAFNLRDSGSGNEDGKIFLYVPEPGNHSATRSFIMRVEFTAATGRVQASTWDEANSTWMTK